MVFCYNREVWQSTDFLSVDTESCKTMQELYQEVIDMDYKPTGVCSRLIHVELDGDKIANVAALLKEWMHTKSSSAWKEPDVVKDRHLVLTSYPKL